MESDIFKFALRILFPVLCSIIIGLILSGTAVFDPSSTTFQFVSFGLFGGLVLATSAVTSVQKSFVALILGAFFYELVFTPFGTHLIVRDAFFLLGIGTTIILFRSYFYGRLNTTALARPLVLGAMLALNGIIVTFVLTFVFSAFFDGIHVPGNAFSANLSLEFLIGIGLGIGDELTQLTKQQWKTLFQAS